MKPLLLCLLLSPLFSLFAQEKSIFDAPKYTEQYLRVQDELERAHKEKRYAQMESFCQTGLQIGFYKKHLYYNLACALALQKKTEEAFQALHRAIDHGFDDTEHTQKDPDLIDLRKDPRFPALLLRMRSAPPDKISTIVNDDGVYLQAETNTIWNFAVSLFDMLITPTVTNRPYQGLMANTLNRWTKEGTADTLAPILYVNRDGHSSHPQDAPNLLKLDYAPEVVERNIHTGFPNTMFLHTPTGYAMPVVGNCSAPLKCNASLPFTFPIWVTLDKEELVRQTRLLLANQLFFFPAWFDYTLDEGDALTANQPVLIFVEGKGGAEKKFLDAAITSILAMQPTVRNLLTSQNLLGITLNKLIRLAQRSVKHPDDYLTGKAHPAVFNPDQLDVEKMVRLAHGLSFPQLTPPVIKTFREINAKGSKHHPADHTFCTSPFCAASLFQGINYTHTYNVEMTPTQKNMRLRWSLLQGDPQKVRIQIDPNDSSKARIEIDYHPLFQRPFSSQKTITTARVEIGVFAEINGVFSLPAILNILFNPNETRQYDAQKRLQVLDHTTPQIDAPSIVLCKMRKNWRDEFLYQPNGDCAGWIRIRDDQFETFTRDGLKIITRDSLGRPDIVHAIKYMSRYTQLYDKDPSQQDKKEQPIEERIIEVDDQKTYRYRYASPNDLHGTFKRIHKPKK